MTEGSQQPVQDPVRANRATVSTATRPSPFASGPVAMVNQIRPGLGVPGQFPGQAVRASPTQLSTPLVPQRCPSASPGGPSSEFSPSQWAQAPLVLPGTAHNPGQATSTTALGFSGHADPTPFQHDRSPIAPFDGVSIAPPLIPIPQRNATGVPNRMVLDDSVGQRSTIGRLSMPDPFENLFDSSEEAVTSDSMLSRPASLSSSHDLSLSPTSRSQPPPGATLQHGLYQQQQHSSLRAFGQTPPPSAPFLGYEDNARLQSNRAPAPFASTPDLLIFDAGKEGFTEGSTPTGATSRPQSLSQITFEAPSLDELVDDFLKSPLAERSGGTENAVSHGNMLVPDTVEGLEILYAQKRWQSLTKKALSLLQIPFCDINMTLEIKSWWLAGLIKDGQYANAANVLDQIGDLNEQLAADGTSSFVPIRMLLLQALLSKCQGEVLIHEKQLFHLVLKLRRAIQQSETMSLFGVQVKAAARWLRIAQFALANHLMHQQKFMVALRICSQIDTQFMDVTDKVVVLSRVGRIRLQMGDLSAAEKLFEAARYQISQVKGRRETGTAMRAEVACELEARLLLNDGLLLFAQNKLQEALSAFDSILHMQIAQVLSSTSTDAELFLDEDVGSSAVNNYAVCSLYCCDVKAAVVALERAIKSNPQRFLNGVVVFNLSSLYDLQFDNATSKSRKEMMKKIARLYGLEHVDPAAYRI